MRFILCWLPTPIGTPVGIMPNFLVFGALNVRQILFRGGRLPSPNSPLCLYSSPSPSSFPPSWLVGIFAGTLRVPRVDLLLSSLCMAFWKVPTAAYGAIISLCIPTGNRIALLGLIIDSKFFLDVGFRRCRIGDA